MLIQEMTRKQFESLPYFKEFEEVDFDSIVLIPTRIHDSSGYNIFEIVACKRDRALGKLHGYDTFSIYMESKFNRVGIDCLRGSSLMRIFLPPDEYAIDTSFHRARLKKGENK